MTAALLAPSLKQTRDGARGVGGRGGRGRVCGVRAVRDGHAHQLRRARRRPHPQHAQGARARVPPFAVACGPSAFSHCQLSPPVPLHPPLFFFFSPLRFLRARATTRACSSAPRCWREWWRRRSWPSTARCTARFEPPIFISSAVLGDDIGRVHQRSSSFREHEQEEKQGLKGDRKVDSFPHCCAEGGSGSGSPPRGLPPARRGGRGRQRVLFRGAPAKPSRSSPGLLANAATVPHRERCANAS